MYFGRWILPLLFAFSCLVAAQAPQSATSSGQPGTPLQQFNDPTNGITFQYPDTWLLNRGGGAYIPTLILQKPNYDPNGDPEYKPDGYVALVGRDAKQGPYRNTNFINGWFLYRVVAGVDEEHCYRKADFADDPSMPEDGWKADWVTIGDVRFRHGSGNGAGLGNQSSQDIYAAVHDNKCYLFETQINTVNEQHGYYGIRDITPEEMEEINRAFDAVAQSVRLNDDSASKSSTALRQAATAIRVPFVGCPSDGQMGPLPAPKPEGVSVSFPANVARRLAYYQAGNGIGILAPRGWYCFLTYGSSGSHLAVTPEPINHTSVLFSSKSISGQAIHVPNLDGGTSGRFLVAKVIARVFPAHIDFVHYVESEGILEPAPSFPRGPYPTDKLRYLNDQIVEFETPADETGLGTDSGLARSDSPIFGAAILVNGEPDLTLVGARLSSENRTLIQPILQKAEADATRPGTQ